MRFFPAPTSCLFAFVKTKKKKQTPTTTNKKAAAAPPMVGNFMDLFVCENMALCCFSLKSYNFILLFCAHRILHAAAVAPYPCLRPPSLSWLQLAHPSRGRQHRSCVFFFGVHVCFLVFVNFIRRSLSLICRSLHSHSGMLARFMCTLPHYQTTNDGV